MGTSECDLTNETEASLYALADTLRQREIAALTELSLNMQAYTEACRSNKISPITFSGMRGAWAVINDIHELHTAIDDLTGRNAAEVLQLNRSDSTYSPADAERIKKCRLEECLERIFKHKPGKPTEDCAILEKGQVRDELMAKLRYQRRTWSGRGRCHSD